MPTKICPDCDGSGRDSWEEVHDGNIVVKGSACHECGGSGTVPLRKKLPLDRKSDRDRNRRTLRQIELRPRNVLL